MDPRAYGPWANQGSVTTTWRKLRRRCRHFLIYCVKVVNSKRFIRRVSSRLSIKLSDSIKSPEASFKQARFDWLKRLIATFICKQINWLYDWMFYETNHTSSSMFSVHMLLKIVCPSLRCRMEAVHCAWGLWFGKHLYQVSCNNEI